MEKSGHFGWCRCWVFCVCVRPGNVFWWTLRNTKNRDKVCFVLRTLHTITGFDWTFLSVRCFIVVVVVVCWAVSFNNRSLADHLNTSQHTKSIPEWQRYDCHKHQVIERERERERERDKGRESWFLQFKFSRQSICPTQSNVGKPNPKALPTSPPLQYFVHQLDHYHHVIQKTLKYKTDAHGIISSTGTLVFFTFFPKKKPKMMTNHLMRLFRFSPARTLSPLLFPLSDKLNPREKE